MASTSYSLGGAHDESLHCNNIKREALVDAAYWRKLCPELTVGEAAVDSKPLHLPHSAQLKQQVDTDGMCLVHASELPWQGIDFQVLAKCVVRLMDHGWPASFIIMYDEVWKLVQQLGGVMQDTTGNAINFDILAWYVNPNYGHVGFSPHRDRQPEDVASSFKPDGSAKYTTAWVPFLDACPENSCLYMLPRWADPGYLAGDADDGPDPLQVALSTKESYQAIRALPAEPGAAVIFTHRIIHWGSKGRQGYHTPRISLSFGCADDSYEPAYLDRSKVLPFPSVPLRAALICAQMIVYHERFDLTPRQLTMFKKVFKSHADGFHKTYRGKVLEEFVAATKDVSNRQQPGAGVSAEGAAAVVQNGSKSAAAGSSKADEGGATVTGASDSKAKTKGKKGEAVEAAPATEAKQSSKPGKGVVKPGKGEGVTVKPQQQEEEDEEEQAGASNGSKKKKSEKQKAPVVAVEEDDEDEEEEGFDLGDLGDSEDVDLLDDALDAMLEARLEGLEYQDDFSSDMAASDDGDDDEHEEAKAKPASGKKSKAGPLKATKQTKGKADKSSKKRQLPPADKQATKRKGRNT